MMEEYDACIEPGWRNLEGEQMSRLIRNIAVVCVVMVLHTGILAAHCLVVEDKILELFGGFLLVVEVFVPEVERFE